MYHTATRIFSTSLAVLLAFSLIFAFRAESASAAPVKTIKYKSTLTISTSDRYVSLDMGSRLNKAKSVKVSSSKNSVVKARAVNNSKERMPGDKTQRQGDAYDQSQKVRQDQDLPLPCQSSQIPLPGQEIPCRQPRSGSLIQEVDICFFHEQRCKVDRIDQSGKGMEGQ